MSLAPSKRRPSAKPAIDLGHSFTRGLGARWLDGDTLRLERCFGFSPFWLVPGWGPLLQRLPRWLADITLATLDRIAYKTPALADVIVSIWVSCLRPRAEQQRA